MIFRKRRSREGKKRQRCIEMLEALGIVVTHCEPNRGYWSHAQQDVYRWEWAGRYNGITVCGGCWVSMTECARAEALDWDRKTDEVWPVQKT